MGEAAGDLGHAPVRPAPRRPTRAPVTTTPRPGPVLSGDHGRARHASPSAARPTPTRTTPRALAASGSERRYAGTRLGRQELDGELLTDAPGALWTVALLERCRALVLPMASHGAADLPPGGGVKARTWRIRAELGPEPYPVHRLRWSPSPWRRTTATGSVHPTGHRRRPAHRRRHLRHHRLREGRGRAWPTSSPTTASPPERPEGWAARRRRRRRDVDRHLHPAESQLVKVSPSKTRAARWSSSVLRTADPDLQGETGHRPRRQDRPRRPGRDAVRGGQGGAARPLPQLEAELLGMIAGGDYEGPGKPRPRRRDGLGLDGIDAWRSAGAAHQAALAPSLPRKVEQRESAVKR